MVPGAAAENMAWKQIQMTGEDMVGHLARERARNPLTVQAYQAQAIVDTWRQADGQHTHGTQTQVGTTANGTITPVPLTSPLRYLLGTPWQMPDRISNRNKCRSFLRPKKF